MTLLKNKTLALAVTALALTTAPAMANDFINNTTFGYVDGDVRQDTGMDSRSDIAVGSITAMQADNNIAQGDVNGDITQDSFGNFHHGGGANSLTIGVGSINANAARQNDVSGTVNGDIRQFAQGHRVVLDAQVGSINAESVDQYGYSYGSFGRADNNRTHGFVNGDITQSGLDLSTTKLKVGSITAK